MNEPPAEPPGEVGEPGSAGPRAVRPTLPERQEDARRILALVLVGIFGFEVIVAMLALWLNRGDHDLQALKDILTLILGPTVALVGSVTGFYFGTRPQEGGKIAPPQE